MLDALAGVLAGGAGRRGASVGLAAALACAVADGAGFAGDTTEGVISASGAVSLGAVTTSARHTIASRSAQILVLASLHGATSGLATVLSAVSH